MWLSDMAEFYTQGGGWMHAITFVSVLAIGIMVERCVFLFFKYNLNANQFMAQINKLVMANNIDRAIKLCNAAAPAALPKVIKAGLTRANKGEVEIANAIEEATLEVIPNITKRTPTLQQLANIATLLGLLGTIMGLIGAFDAVGNAPPDQKTAMLTAMISIAMNTTGFGLMVAIPTLGAFIFLNNTVKKIIDEIDQYSVKLQNLLVSRGKGTQSPLDR